MIEMVARNGPPEAAICPAFICDHCRKQVLSSDNTFIVFKMKVQEPHECTLLFVACAGACIHHVDRYLDTQYPQSEGWGYPKSINIGGYGNFIGHLNHNAGESFDADPDGKYFIQKGTPA